MIKYLTLFFLLAISLQAKSNINFTNTDKEIIFYTYNFQFDKAQSLLNSQLKKNPDDLKYYFLTLGLKSMQIEKAVYDEKPALKRELKTKMLEEAIKYADGIVEKFEDVEKTTENKFYLGCIYGYLGRMHGVTRSWMSAFSDGKTGRNLLEDVIEENPDFHDAYLLLGMVNYYADRMGGFIGFVAGVLGFSGDRETGLDYILKTYNKGSLLSDQAELLLIELYSSLEGNGFSALPFHRKFVKKYPNNYHMKNWYVRDLIRYEMIDEAKEVIEKDTMQLIDPYFRAHVYNKSGDYLLSNKYIDICEKNISFYYDGMKEQLKFLRTMNFWMQEDKKYSESAKKLNNEYSEIFTELNKEPVLGRQIMLFGNEVSKNRLSEKSGEFLKKSPQIKNQFLDILLSYYKGIHYYRNEKYDLARRNFERVEYFDKKHFHFSSVQYLIDIFSRIEVPKTKVEILLEVIDEHEYENLSFWAKDLEKKYKLN